ncbi:uncharacterized protein LOC130440750 [Diorhabda sublineata]|uniref:uncharacterized protein LOC130440750 n=1 Tax=Diorhabda sublineata TaxID=1163346 RepID=UPI0024E0B229|nr:uncharacterized protein LOC130440750 [Diorhabda sublineata]
MDQAEARREARIRKILENSEKRLQKITGVENKSTKTSIEGTNRFQSHKEESGSLADNFPLSGKSDKYNKPSNLDPTCNSSLSDEYTSNTQLNSLDENLLLESSKNNSNRKVMIVLPFIWSILITTCNIFQLNFSEVYTNKIFLPLIAFEIKDLYFSPSISNTKSKLLSAMSLLTGKMYSRKKFHFILYIVKILQDIMVYFFIFVSSQIFIKSIFKLEIQL